MKTGIVNGRWNLWMTDAVADHDIITGDYSARRGWEFERFESFRRHLRYGDTLFDIGSEHGWISAILAREFVGAENMVLMEPSPEFWGNIYKVWQYNGLDGPAAFWPGFVGDISSADSGIDPLIWPTGSSLDTPEVGGMAYRYIGDSGAIPTITIDDFVAATKVWPEALNIDVEGAELLVLRGAEKELNDSILANIFLSIHPDLMLNGFGHRPEDIFAFMAKQDFGRWKHELLGIDHEEHHRFWRDR